MNERLDEEGIASPDTEIYRLKTEISNLNRSVQSGTSLNHDDIERKVLENEARIRELEKGAAEPEPTHTEITPDAPAAPESTPKLPVVANSGEQLGNFIAGILVDQAKAREPGERPNIGIDLTDEILTDEPTPEAAPTSEVAPVAPNTPETSPIAGVALSPDNQSRFSKMTEGAKKIASKLYEGVRNMPIVQETVGKMQIAYNQTNANEYEKRMAENKRRMDGLDIRINAVDTFKAKVEEQIAELKKRGLPGGESLEVRIRESEQTKNKLAGKKDRNQSSFEEKDNRRKIHMEKRDTVAEKLISLYDSKLNPIEKELGIATGKLDQIDLDIAVAEAKHRNNAEKLAETEKLKAQIEESLRASDMSERKIRNFDTIKTLTEMIRLEKATMNREREDLLEARLKISEQIAKISEKANPLRDKREEYIRIKNTRGTNMKVEARTKGVDNKATETVSGNPRVDAEPTEEVQESPEAIKETQEYINIWNEVIKDNNGDIKKQIELNDFIRETKFSAGEKMSSADFQNVLARYYKRKKMPLNTFVQDMKKFQEKLTNN